jgi:hypothetical protein
LFLVIWALLFRLEKRYLLFGLILIIFSICSHLLYRGI